VIQALKGTTLILWWAHRTLIMKHGLQHNICTGDGNINRLYLIPKCRANLSCSKWQLVPILIVEVLEIDKNALCCLWAHVPVNREKENLLSCQVYLNKFDIPNLMYNIFHKNREISILMKKK